MLIMDTTMIACEYFHFMNHKCHRSKGFVSVKLDMAKAYDRIGVGLFEKPYVGYGVF